MFGSELVATPFTPRSRHIPFVVLCWCAGMVRLSYIFPSGNMLIQALLHQPDRILQEVKQLTRLLLTNGPARMLLFVRCFLFVVTGALCGRCSVAMWPRSLHVAAFHRHWFAAISVMKWT